MVNTGKYTSPMDPMGIVLIMEKLGSLSHFLSFILQVEIVHKCKTGWWLNQPIWNTLIKMGSSSLILGVKIKNIWVATT